MYIFQRIMLQYVENNRGCVMFVICVHDSSAIYRIKIFTNAIGINEPTRISPVASMISRSSGQKSYLSNENVCTFFLFVHLLPLVSTNNRANIICKI